MNTARVEICSWHRLEDVPCEEIKQAIQAVVGEVTGAGPGDDLSELCPVTFPLMDHVHSDPLIHVSVTTDLDYAERKRIKEGIEAALEKYKAGAVRKATAPLQVAAQRELPSY